LVFDTDRLSYLAAFELTAQLSRENVERVPARHGLNEVRPKYDQQIDENRFKMNHPELSQNRASRDET